MEKRTFNKIVEDKRKTAKFVVESAKQYNVTIPELPEMQEVLKNPVEAVKEEVLDLANLAATVHDVGLSPDEPAVERFANEKLGMTSQEFGEILEKSNSFEEVKVNVLEEMETPQEIINEVTKKTNNKTK